MTREAQAQARGGLLERLFHLSEWNTTVRTEIMSGLTTFITMAYILAVVPSTQSAAGIPKAPMTVALILVVAACTIAMGLYTNRPLALGPGMGSVAFLTVTLVVANKIPVDVAFGMVFIEGVFFVLLTLFGLRQLVVDIIPKPIKLSTGMGVGLFLALLGFKNAGLIVANPASNTLAFGKLGNPGALLALIGIIVTAAFIALKVQGHILWGILATTLIGIPMGLTKVPSSLVSLPTGIGQIAFHLDIMGALKVVYLPFMFTFFMSDFFSTLGTVLAIGAKGKMLDKDGNFPQIDKPFLIDALSTVVGSLFCCPVMTTYVESTAGVENGGRTGLTAVSTGIFFLLTVFLVPVALMIPTQATAPALVLIGAMMLSTIKQVNLDDFSEAFPAFMTIALTIFTFNFANGIAGGVISYLLLKILTGKFKEIHPGLYILALPLLYYFWMIR